MVSQLLYPFTRVFISLRHAVKCESLLHQLRSGIRVNGYSDIALEGTNITLECSLPNLILIGPNETRCTGNGKWEPDPREVMCIGES